LKTNSETYNSRGKVVSFITVGNRNFQAIYLFNVDGISDRTFTCTYTTYLSDLAGHLSHETSFHVKSQSTALQSTGNPHVTCETLLHTVDIGVRCAVIQHHVVGSIFFTHT